MVPDPAPPTAVMPLLLLLLLLWGIECVRGQGSQAGTGAGAGAPIKPQSPPEPWSLDDGYQLQVQSVTVQEGLSVFIPCTFSYPQDGWNRSDPVFKYWFQKGADNINHIRDVPVAKSSPYKTVKEETKGRFQLLGDPQANNCSLHITGAQRKDTGKYVFRMERGKLKYNYKEMLSVTVTALTNVPDIITGSLKSGHESHVGCYAPWACDGETIFIFSWMGAALRSLGLKSSTHCSSVITLTPGPQDHGTNLTCRVTSFPETTVTTERTITLNVSYAPQNLTICLHQGDCKEPKCVEHLGNGSSVSILEGQSLCLMCVVDSSPTATLTWIRVDRPESPSPSDPAVLELLRVQKEDEGKVTCEARNSIGSQRLSLWLSVLYAPQLQDPTCSWEAEDLRCSCSARAQPAPSLRWRLGDGLVEGNSSNVSVTVTSSSEGPWVNSSLSLHGGYSPGLGLHCEALNDHGAHRVTVLLLPGIPEQGGGFVQAAFLGAGVTSLVFLCPCLLFLMVKTLRKKATKTAGNQDRADAASHHCVESLEDISARQRPGQPILDCDPTYSGEEQELRYASLIFQGPRPQEPWDQEALSTEYAEIKIRE